MYLSVGAVDGNAKLAESHACHAAYLVAAVERLGVGKQVHGQIALVHIVKNVPAVWIAERVAARDGYLRYS